MTNAAPGTTDTTATPAPATQNTAAPATAPGAITTAAGADDDAYLDSLEASAPATPAAAPKADKLDATATQATAPDTATDADAGDDLDALTDGLALPGVKGTGKADPVAGRREIAVGRQALADQGFDEAEIAAMKPERVAEFGRRAMAARTADDADNEAAPATAAQTPTAGLADFDKALGATLLDDAEKQGLRAAAEKAIAAGIQAGLGGKVKELQAAQAKADEAASAHLRMRFNTALRPMLSEFPKLKEGETLKALVAEMGNLDPEGRIGLGSDDKAFNKLLRNAAFVVLGDSIAQNARQGMLTQSRKHAAAAPERPIGNANPASKAAQGISEDDLVLDAIEASGGNQNELSKRLAQLPGR